MIELNLFDIGAKKTTLKVSAASSQQSTTRMPIETESSGFNLLLDMLSDPEALFRLVVAHTNASLSTSDGKLLLIGRPLDTSGSAVDSQDDELRTPLVGASIQRPHVRVLIGTAGHQPVALSGPIDTEYLGRVFTQCLCELPST